MSERFQLMHGDCLEVMKTLADSSVDAVVTDPPYGLAFMGKKWDYDVPSEDVWRECLRVLKPGGHLLAFAGTRTQHRMAVRIEDAGFEIRDMIAWCYGSGFPKSLDVSKAIDKAAGAEREVVESYKATGTARTMTGGNYGGGGNNVKERDRIFQTAPATEAARQWQGWGTALKPAMEPITVARKPLDGTVAQNVLRHGTGGINVDGCRVGTDAGWSYPNGRGGSEPHHMERGERNGVASEPCKAIAGRWPANLIHDGSDEVVGLFPVTTSGKPGVMRLGENRGAAFGAESRPPGTAMTGHGDTGSAARFFYTAKASRADRNSGGVNSSHPTVKPTDLMRYLCRLVTPEGGIVLDPFMGSGSTGKAAMLEGFRFIGIEREAEYIEIARRRIAKVTEQGMLF